MVFQQDGQDGQDTCHKFLEAFAFMAMVNTQVLLQMLKGKILGLIKFNRTYSSNLKQSRTIHELGRHQS